LARNLRGGG